MMTDQITSARNKGLSEAQVKEARQRAGWNELPEVKRSGPLKVLLRQFSSFLILILVLAAGVAFFIGETIDALAIVLVIFLNAILGFVQEWRAENALASLRQLLSPKAKVIRDGQDQVIPARDIVPGDILLLAAGDKIAADAVLERATEMSVDESVLTGESQPVAKSLENDKALIFAGTIVTAGRAEAKVVATGGDTEFGRIAHLTQSFEEKQTNLQLKLSELAVALGIAAMLIAAAILVLGLLVGRDGLEMAMTGLSLAVAMVPEGLPAVVTITLALGASAMVRQKALARKLQAVETLGAASVICSDKTGTMTENKMTATKVWALSRTYDVTGTGYDPTGHIELDGLRLRASDDQILAEILRAGLFCNHARLQKQGTAWEMIGEPTEGALVTLAYKGWCDFPNRSNILAEIPFSSTRKRMSILYDTGHERTILTKGAPEQVMEICTRVLAPDGVLTLSADHSEEITKAYTALAEQGLRVIALAKGVTSGDTVVEDDLIFLGLIGLIDPPRAEVREAIGATRSAGIRVIMITGDSPVTALAIANQVSLNVSRCITGAELDEMGSKELFKALATPVLFARTKPEHKMRIVSALQECGHIVAMTGDGVNDAPALKQADIGVSMGIRGTDVARDASDLVLLDDNFATIVRAIGEGRRQFANVQKFVRYLLASNAGEVIALVINIAIGGPLVFLATQILWMNLVTDGVTAVALGLEKSEPDQMEHPPRAKDTPILGLGGLGVICCLGLYTGISSLWIFFHLMDQGLEIARTTAFTAMVIFEKVSVFAFRSLRLPGWRIGWLSNKVLWLALTVTIGAQLLAVYWPPLQVLLHTAPIGVAHWQLILLFALPILVVPEILKSLPLRQRMA